MTSSISWIDRESLKVTLARFGGSTWRVPAIGEHHDPEPRRTATPELIPVVDVSETEPRVIPEFIPPSGALRRRLDAFMTWLEQISGSRIAFIVDRDGLPLVDRRADPDLLAIASSVMRLMESINSKLFLPVGRAVTLELEEDQLVLISVETPIGQYIVGQVGERALDRPLRRATSEALRRAFLPDLEPEPVGS